MNFEEAMGKVARNSMYESDYLPEFFVWWDSITREQLADFQNVLTTAKTESDMQRYLEANPLLLIPCIPGLNVTRLAG
jgi:hypothetical protein